MRLIIALLIVIALLTYAATHAIKQLRAIGKNEAERINKAYTTKTNGKEENK